MSPQAKARAKRRAAQERAATRKNNQRTGIYTGPLTQTKPSGYVCRKNKGASDIKGQHAPDGGGWNNSPYIRDAVMTDARWSKTVGDTE